VLLPVIPLLAVVGLFVALGIAVTARPLSQGFVSWLQNAGRVAQFFGGISATIAVKLTRWITHNIGAEWSDLERLGVTWLSGLFQWADLAVTNALEWPLWLWRVQRWLLFTELPHLLKQVPHAIAGTVTHIVTQVRTVERTVVKLPKLSKAAAKALVAAAVATYVHPFLADLQWLRRHFHALTAVLPRALPIPQVPAFPNVWKRLKALEKKIGVPVALGVVAVAISRLGLGWTRCNNVRRIGKQLCGLNPSLLDELLLDSVAIFSLLSVVEFAKELRTVEDEAVAIMGRLVREWPA
jgi:hypothetical protein